MESKLYSWLEEKIINSLDKFYSDCNIDNLQSAQNIKIELKDMIPDVRYVVVDCANKGSLRIGDHIYVDSNDLCLICSEAGGIHPPDDWRAIRICSVVFDKDFYISRIKHHFLKIEECLELLCKFIKLDV